MFRELTTDLPEPIGPYAPFPAAGDRSFWEGLEPGIAAAIVAAGERRLGFEYPTLPPSLYLDFARTGDRSRFEARYFGRRRALNDFVLAECVTADGRFLDGVIDGIDAMCSEGGWQLPAHNAYVRDTPQLPLPSPDRPVLDLFACETGAQLSAALYLLGDRLDAVSPFIRDRVEGLVRTRILEPYLNEHFWWMGNGDEPMNNWTPWCTQNVLVAAAFAGVSGETRRAIIEKAAGSLDAFLKDYGDDGCCSEGAQYYRHAGLCLFGAMETLDALAPGRFSRLYRETKVRNIAEYIRNAYAGNGYYVNFADCSPKAGPAGAREFLFGRRIESDALRDFAARDFAAAADKSLPGEINLFYRAQSVAAAREIGEWDVDADATGPTPDAWYPSVGLLVARSERLCLAAKAGGNDDSHNHNDTGSFTLYKDGRPCLIDVGVETYTAKTFSPRRYEIWTMQSSWHNLPDFAGRMQEAGAEYRARDVAYQGGDAESALAMDIAGAWAPEAMVQSYVRRVTLSKEQNRVTVRDRYRGTFPATMNLMVEQPPEATGEGFRIGDLARVAVSGATGPIQIERVEIRDERLALAWTGAIYRVRVPFGDGIEITIE